jgi:hypothetical protein
MNGRRPISLRRRTFLLHNALAVPGCHVGNQFVLHVLLLDRVRDQDYPARVERAVRIDVRLGT